MMSTSILNFGVASLYDVGHYVFLILLASIALRVLFDTVAGRLH